MTNVVWILIFMSGYYGVDGRHFQTRAECHEYAKERTASMKNPEWYCGVTVRPAGAAWGHRIDLEPSEACERCLRVTVPQDICIKQKACDSK